MREGIDSFKELTTSLMDLAKTADDALVMVQEKIEPLDLAELEMTLTAQLSAVSDQLAVTAKTLDTGTQSMVFGTRNVEHQLATTLEIFDEAVRSIRDLAEYLRENPSALVYRSGPEGEEE